MVCRKLQRKPTFVWQAVLILLPVLILSLVGFLFLHQDRLLARREAADRAQGMADDLLAKVWSRLISTNYPGSNAPVIFQVDASGNLISPPSLTLAPAPQPYEPATLTSDQAEWWRQAQQSEESDPATAISSYRAFIASNPPDNFAAQACYSLGVLLMRKTPTRHGIWHEGSPEAGQLFYTILEKYPQATGESGLPLRPLAELKLLSVFPPNPFNIWGRTGIRETTSSSEEDSRINPYKAASNALPKVPLVTLATVASNAVYQPTPLTPAILETLSGLVRMAFADPQSSADPQFSSEIERLRHDPELDVQKWLTLWEEHQKERELFKSLRPHLLNPASAQKPAIWFETERASPTNGSAVFPWLAKWVAFRSEPGVLTLKETLSSRGPVDPLTPLAFGVNPDGMKLINSLSTQTPSADPGVHTNLTIICYSGSDLDQRLAFCLGEMSCPDYLGIGFEIAGEKIRAFGYSNLHVWHEVGYMGRRGGGVKKEWLPELAKDILASAVHSARGTELLRVDVYLTSPSDLFKHQRARTFWFGSLIGTSFLTALIGLIAAGRAFGRQQQFAEMKTNFVSSVSHELRAPIASVRLLAESLERGSVSEAAKQSQYYHFIGQECRRLSALIENILDFSRIEQGRKQYEPEPTDLLKLTRQTVALMESYAAEKGVFLRLDISGVDTSNSLEMLIDGQAMQQALINLIDNAFKHSAQGQEVTVGLTSSAASDQSTTVEVPDTKPTEIIQLYVEDHGPGIPSQEHEKIFERFYRLGSELRRETQGIGIGLSLVKHAVEAHAAKVRVRSAPGQGSRFTIELPRQEMKP